jgi:hypothetical protein
MLNDPITEEWLKSVGFKWHQFDRQPDKQWLLWLGDPCAHDTQDIGIELAPWKDGEWFCWLRSDTAHRYSRFLHVRHMRVVGDVIRLIVAITDQDWNPANHFHGADNTPQRAARIREDRERLDQRIMRDGRPWRDIEKDDSRGGALPEHMQHAIDAKLAK